MPIYVNKKNGRRAVFASAPSAGLNVDLSGNRYHLIAAGSAWIDGISGDVWVPVPSFGV